ncbi:hypothetical protein CR513_37742, partial [Mucuna pruriens]
MEPPYSRNYDPNAKCDYHTGAVEHSMERCWALKHKVQDLVEGGWLNFKENGPSLLNQMNKTPTRISLLSLLLNFESHQNLLLNTLNEAHMAQDITMERFSTLVNNITSRGHLVFSNEEVPAEGKGHNQPLYISVKCADYMIVRV